MNLMIEREEEKKKKKKRRKAREEIEKGRKPKKIIKNKKKKKEEKENQKKKRQYICTFSFHQKPKLGHLEKQLGQKVYKKKVKNKNTLLLLFHDSLGLFRCLK